MEVCSTATLVGLSYSPRREIPLLSLACSLATYSTVPITLTAWVINGKASFESLREAREYVKYPSEDDSHSFKDIESALNKAKGK